MMGRTIFALLALLAPLARPAPAETVRFPAADGIEITAELTRPDQPATVVLVLFHMAGASRGEYDEIAPRLVQMGYATLAVDQRSGGRINGVANETVRRASGSQAYAAALPDLEAAAAYARESLGAERVGVVGSSYSAALALALAGRSPDFADAVAAFSPGEYFPEADFVRRDAARIAVPVFVTGAAGEERLWEPIAAVIPGPVTAFRPAGQGAHGASALVGRDAGPLWTAFAGFLMLRLPPR